MSLSFSSGRQFFWPNHCTRVCKYGDDRLIGDGHEGQAVPHLTSLLAVDHRAMQTSLSP